MCVLKGSKLNDPASIFLLATSYDYGIGTSSKYTLAIKNYQKFLSLVNENDDLKEEIKISKERLDYLLGRRK